jgi:hypothetical protein
MVSIDREQHEEITKAIAEAMIIAPYAYIMYKLLAPPPSTGSTVNFNTTTGTAPNTPNTPFNVTTSSGVEVYTGLSTTTPGSGTSTGQAGQYTTPNVQTGSTVTTIGPFASIGLARAYAANNLTLAGSVNLGSDGLYYLIIPGGTGGTINVSPAQSGIAPPTPPPAPTPQYIAAPVADSGYTISSNGFILQSDAQNLANSKGNSQVIQSGDGLYYVETLLNPPAPALQGIFTVTGSDGSTWTGTLSQMLNHFGAGTSQIGGGWTGNNGVNYTVVSER